MEIRVLHTPHLAAIKSAIADIAPDSSRHFADLSLGAWRPHQLAAEWLGVCDDQDRAAASQPTTPLVPPSIDFAQIAAAGIEAEALGIRSVREAHTKARQLLANISGQTSHTFFVVAPLAQESWREENLHLLQALRESGDGGSHRVVILKTSRNPAESVIPEGLADSVDHAAIAFPCVEIAETPLAALPGLLPASLVSDTGLPGLILEDGRLLVAPEARVVGAATGVYDCLKPRLARFGWLSAFAAFRGGNFHLDPKELAWQATGAFQAGSHELAIDLLGRAIECARGGWKRGLLCQLQGYRIATHRFDDAAEQDLPFTGQGQVGAFLEMSRGWGLALTGRGAEALPYLERASALLSDDPDQRFSLYLDNITALALARAGRLDEALVLEQRIEQTNIPPDRDWAMHYVNQINLARLYFAKKETQAATRHYSEAFATQEGARSAVDRIYRNAVQARLCEANGNDARQYWLRAALYFAAWDTPDALGIRHAASFIPGGGADLSTTARTEAVAAALADRLELPEAFGSDELPVLHVGDDMPLDCEPIGLLAGEGWSALALGTASPQPRCGPQLQRLRSGLVARLLGEARPIQCNAIAALLIDHQLGCEMALSDDELAGTAVRLNVDELHRDGRVYRLNSDARRGIVLGSKLRLNQQAIRIEPEANGQRILFKRYREPLWISDSAKLIKKAESGTDLCELGSECDVLALVPDLRRLERAGLVQLAVPSKAGLAWGAP